MENRNFKKVRIGQVTNENDLSKMYVQVDSGNTSNIFVCINDDSVHFLYAPNTRIINDNEMDKVYQIGSNGKGFGKGHIFNLYCNKLQKTLDKATDSILLYTENDLFACNTLSLQIVGMVNEKSFNIINSNNKLIVRKNGDVLEGITEKKMDNATFERIGELNSVNDMFILDGKYYAVKHNDLDYTSMFYSYIGYPTKHTLQFEIVPPTIKELKKRENQILGLHRKLYNSLSNNEEYFIHKNMNPDDYNIDEFVKPIQPKGKYWTIDELKSLIGCEEIYFFSLNEDKYLISNKLGYWEKESVNDFATELYNYIWLQHYGRISPDPIFGNALIINSNSIE